MSWHAHVDGKQIGPISAHDLRSYISSGKVKPTDQVFGPGMSRWVNAAEVEILLKDAPQQSVPSPEFESIAIVGGPSATRTSHGSTSRQYLEAIRGNSCYPTFRGFVQVFTLLGYLVAIFIVIAAVMSGQGATILFGIAGAIVTVLLIHVAKEVSLMLADIADATINSSANSVLTGAKRQASQT